ncbi:hypothetical protein D3C86_2135460 [compost metagenome]
MLIIFNNIDRLVSNNQHYANQKTSIATPISKNTGTTRRKHKAGSQAAETYDHSGV